MALVLTVLSTIKPGTAVNSAPYERVAGNVLTMFELSTVSRRVVCTSTTGVSPVTVTVSETAPTRRSALIVMTPDPVTSRPSRFTTLKPGSVNVNAYVPGRRSTIWY